MSQAVRDPSDAEIAAFVEHLVQLRYILPSSGQALLDALVSAAAQAPDDDVTGYGLLESATARRVALAAALALGLGVGSAVAPTASAVQAAPMEQTTPAGGSTTTGQSLQEQLQARLQAQRDAASAGAIQSNPPAAVLPASQEASVPQPAVGTRDSGAVEPAAESGPAGRTTRRLTDQFNQQPGVVEP
jgi:hypothetical protein